MSDTFTGDRSTKIWENERGGIRYEHYRAGSNLIEIEVVQDLRQFLQHERDKELGRWRDPERPNILVYARSGEENVRVVDERAGWVWEISPTTKAYETSVLYDVVKAGHAYFAAHPEPKPEWHDAKPGEVWVLRVRDEPEERPYTVGDTGFNGEDIRGEYWGAIPIESNVFTAGRRIWPEVTP